MTMGMVRVERERIGRVVAVARSPHEAAPGHRRRRQPSLPGAAFEPVACRENRPMWPSARGQSQCQDQVSGASGD